MDNFSIILTNEKAATYKVVTFIIAGINLLAFVYFLLAIPGVFIQWVSGIGLCLLAAVCVHYVWLSSRSTIRFFNLVFLCCAICWIMLGIYLGGLLLGIAALFGWFVSKELSVRFSTEGCLYPSFPPQLIHWSEIEQVILKDNVLTLDLKNNQLLQFVIAEKENIPDELVFNLFCKQQLQHQTAS